jgi:hypothetical protein
LSRPLPGLKAAQLLDPGTLTGADKVFRLDGYSNSIHSPSRPRKTRDTHEDPAE